MRGVRILVSCGITVALVGVAGCSSDTSSSPTTTEVVATTTATTDAVPESTAALATTPSTDAPEASGASTSTTAPATDAPDTTTGESPDDKAIAGFHSIVDFLASDDLAGRDNGTAGSAKAQSFLIGLLAEFAKPMSGDPADPGSYMQEFDVGTNLIGLIPGTDLADQYVIVGAHYDHVGSDCAGTSATDNICNGATDNATGVAAAMTIGRALATGAVAPRRSVIIALWDAEEDGLLGSAAYLANPLVPLAQTVGYVNFDIQGTNISPHLTGVTVAVGAETGGPNLIDATKAATAESTLDTVMLSLLFGQGRSDHANFVNAGVPSVFFSDATPPCYHTAQDDSSIVDYPKLVQQVATAQALTTTLANTDALPAFDPNAPAASFADAVAIHDLILQAQPDFTRFSPADKATADQFVTDLGVIVDAGPGAFDDAAVGALLGGTVQIVSLWASGVCDGFLGD